MASDGSSRLQSLKILQPRALLRIYHFIYLLTYIQSINNTKPKLNRERNDLGPWLALHKRTS